MATVLRDARIKAAAIRNPVTNVAAMWGISDIPDWTIVEACGVDADPRATPTAEQLAKMWEVSPIARPLVGGQPGRVVPPCLFLLGMKDRRVPPSQGLHFAAALRQAGSAARIRSYPDDCHPLELWAPRWTRGCSRSSCSRRRRTPRRRVCRA